MCKEELKPLDIVTEYPLNLAGAFACEKAQRNIAESLTYAQPQLLQRRIRPAMGGSLRSGRERILEYEKHCGKRGVR